MSDDKDPQRISDAADNCEVLRARLAKYEDAEGRPVGLTHDQAELVGLVRDLALRAGKHARPLIHAAALGLESQAREIERLKAWKSEEMEVMTPLLDYARSVCQGPLGCSITEWLVSDHKRLAALKAQPSGVVLPPRMVCEDGYPSDDWLETNAHNRCLDEVARLNSSPVSANQCGDCGYPITTGPHCISHNKQAFRAGGVDERAAFDRQEAVNALYHCISGPGDCYAAARRVFDAGYRLNSSPVSAGDTLGKCPECEDRIACEAGSIAMYSTLAAALKRLTFAARTSGGTAGPDAELMAACAQAEDALSMGSAGRAFMEAAGKTPSFAQENAAFEEWRKLQMSVLSEEGAAAFYRLGSVQWSGWQARASLSAPSHGEQVRESEPDFYWVEADEGSWNSPEEWAQDYYDYNGEKPESVSFSCAAELPTREYDSFEFDANGNCISCRLVTAAPSAGSQQGVSDGN